jgi:hypothetical protein
MTLYVRADLDQSVPPPLESPSLPPAQALLNGSYNFVPTVSGGEPPYSFALTGTLPVAFTFNSATGGISATAAAPLGAITGLSITVTDAASNQVVIGPFAITVVSTVSGELIASPVSRPWVAGAIYIDADDGDDANPGTWTNQADEATYRPIKSLDRFQVLLNAAPNGVTHCWKRTDARYRRTSAGALQGGVTDSVAVNIEKNGQRMIAWGDQSKKARLCGDVVLTGWTAITPGTGSAFAEANGGEQVAVPWDAEAHHAPCIGDDMSTPAFWSSNKSDIDVASRWMFDTRFPGDEVFERLTKAQTFIGTTTHDTGFRLSWISTPPQGLLTAPGAAARYAAEEPVGAIFRYTGSGTASRSVRIGVGAFDSVNERFTLNNMTTRPQYNSSTETPWAIVAWKRDIRQAGQYGYAAPGVGSRLLHVVWPSGATGEKSVIYYRNVARIMGDDVRWSPGFSFDRCVSFGLIIRCKTWNGEFSSQQQIGLEGDRAGQLLSVSSRTTTRTNRGSSGYLQVGGIEQCQTGGGITIADHTDLVVDAETSRGFVERNDNSSWRLGAKAESVTIKGELTRWQTGVHGNTSTNYERMKFGNRIGGASLGVLRAITHQTDGDNVSITSCVRLSATRARVVTPAPHGLVPLQWIAFDSGAAAAYVGIKQIPADGIVDATTFDIVMPTDPVTDINTPASRYFRARPFGYTGKRMRYERFLIWGARAISTSTGAADLSSNNILRVDCDFEGCVLDRCISWLANTGLYFGVNDGRQAFNNFFRVQSDATYAGATNSQNIINSGAGWNGALSIGASGQWDAYSRVIDASGVWDGSSYETAIIGPNGLLDGQDWTVPAFTLSPSFPTPRAVTPSDRRFLINAGPGVSVFHCLGGEPGSTYSLPAGQLDNNVFGVDNGIVFVGAGRRLSSPSYQLRVRKTNAAFPGPGYIETDITLSRLR